LGIRRHQAGDPRAAYKNEIPDHMRSCIGNRRPHDSNINRRFLRARLGCSDSSDLSPVGASPLHNHLCVLEGKARRCRGSFRGRRESFSYDGSRFHRDFKVQGIRHSGSGQERIVSLSGKHHTWLIVMST
jgi:hypothetical protein